MEEKEKEIKNEKKELLLTPKQKRFVQLFVRSGGQIANSYMTVYKSTNKSSAASAGSRMLKRTDIRSAIELEMLSLKSLERIDKHYVVQKLKSLVERNEASGNDKYILQGLEMLCKIAGFFNHISSTEEVTHIQENTHITFGDYDPQTNNVINIEPQEIEDNGNDDDGQDD